MVFASSFLLAMQMSQPDHAAIFSTQHVLKNGKNFFGSIKSMNFYSSIFSLGLRIKKRQKKLVRFVESLVPLET